MRRLVKCPERQAVVAVIVCALAVVGCSSSGSTSSNASGSSTTTGGTASATTATSGGSGSVDPCSLLTDDEVHQVAPKAGAHRIEHPVKSVTICAWPNSSGVPEVQLQVSPRPAGTLKSDMSDFLGTGYSYVEISGLGDEAAAAFQKADPSIGTTSGLADIEVRKGDQVVSMSVSYVQIDPDSPEFDTVKSLMATAVDRLP